MSNRAWTNNGQGSKQPPGHAHTTDPQGPIALTFNAQEAKDLLKMAFKSAVSADGSALSYKSSGSHTNYAKSGGPWASNSRNMANGKDFYLELRKQVSVIQQGSASSSTRGG